MSLYLFNKLIKKVTLHVKFRAHRRVIKKYWIFIPFVNVLSFNGAKHLNIYFFPVENEPPIIHFVEIIQ